MKASSRYTVSVPTINAYHTASILIKLASNIHLFVIVNRCSYPVFTLHMLGDFFLRVNAHMLSFSRGGANFAAHAESVEWFIDGQAFSRCMIWLLAHPPPHPLSRLYARPTRHTGRQRKWDNLLTGWRGGGGGERGAKSYDRKKAKPGPL